MAKIPSFQQNTRLAPVGGGDPVNARQARAPGENLANLGEATTRFAGAMSDYMDRRREVDYALRVAETKQKLTMKAIEGEMFAKTNPEASRDGSGTQQDFSKVYNDARDEMIQVEDPKLRARLMTVSTQVEGAYRNKLLGYQIEKHNSFVLEKSQEVINDMGAQIQQNPDLIGEKLQDFDMMAEKMPYAGSNKEKFITTGRRSLVTAAIESFAYKGDYQAAREMLNNTAAASMYSTEERAKLTKDLQAREVGDFNYNWNIEQRNRTRMKQEKSDRQEQVENKLFSSLLESETPAQQGEILKSAEAAFKSGVLSRQAFNAIKTEQRGISAAESSAVKGNFTLAYLKGQKFENIKPQVFAAMEAGTMNQKDGLDLLNTLSKQARRENLDPRYKTEKTVAKEYIKTAVTPTGMSAFGSIFRNEEKQQIVQINEMVLKLEAEGKSPMEAAKEATARVLGVAELRSNHDPEINRINDSPENLQKYGSVVVKKYQKAIKEGRMTPEVEKKTAQTLYEIKVRQEQLKQKAILDSILKLGSSK